MLTFKKIVLVTLTVLWGLYYVWSVGLLSNTFEGEDSVTRRDLFHVVAATTMTMTHLSCTLFLFGLQWTLIFKITSGLMLLLWTIFTTVGLFFKSFKTFDIVANISIFIACLIVTILAYL